MIPADQRDVDGTYRPGKWVDGLRSGLGRPDPLRAAPHRDWIAVGGHSPGGDPIGCFSDSRQNHLDAYPVGIEADAWTRRRLARL